MQLRMIKQKQMPIMKIEKEKTVEVSCTLHWSVGSLWQNLAEKEEAVEVSYTSHWFIRSDYDNA